jgi:uncharacterized protein YlxW (UPF0749 family)
MSEQGTAGVRGADAAAGAATRVRERLNLIEQINQAAVASDYEQAGAESSSGASAPRQRAVVAFFGLGMAGLIIALGLSARILNEPVVVEQRAALRDRIEQADARGHDLAAKVVDLRAEVQEARAADLETTQAGRLVAAQISRYELVTGFTPVTGGGAVVTMTDAKNPSSGQEDLSKVLDSDVQEAVNGLWEAGAEAIAVNSQRLTSRSAIRSAAGAILVNYRPLRPPYVIEAIGPGNLSERFSSTGSAMDLQGVARRFGIGLDIATADALTLPAATVSPPEQAQVADDSEGTGKQ